MNLLEEMKSSNETWLEKKDSLLIKLREININISKQSIVISGLEKEVFMDETLKNADARKAEIKVKKNKDLSLMKLRHDLESLNETKDKLEAELTYLETSMKNTRAWLRSKEGEDK